MKNKYKSKKPSLFKFCCIKLSKNKPIPHHTHNPLYPSVIIHGKFPTFSSRYDTTRNPLFCISCCCMVTELSSKSQINAIKDALNGKTYLVFSSINYNPEFVKYDCKNDSTSSPIQHSPDSIINVLRFILL